MPLCNAYAEELGLAALFVHVQVEECDPDMSAEVWVGNG